MSSPLVWNRRTFLSALGLAGITAALPRVNAREPALASGSSGTAGFLAFVGLTSESQSENCGPYHIRAYKVEDGRWIAAAPPFPAERPHGLALHPTMSVLYAVHSTAQHRHLPRGSVSAFSFDPVSGALTPMGRQSLALSATFPEHLAVSPDGRALLISAAGGGAYNLFALSPDGAILPIPYPLKQTGAGPHPLQRTASPRAAVFQRGGLAAYATDLGADRINHIAFSARSEDGTPILRSRISLPPGSGPASIALHPSGDFLIVAGYLQPGLTIIPLSSISLEILAPLSHYALHARSGGPITLNPSGDLVYFANTSHSGEAQLSTFRLACSTGRITPVHHTNVPLVREPRQLLRIHNQLLLTGAGGVVALQLITRTGLPGEPKIVVPNFNVVSLAVRI